MTRAHRFAVFASLVVLAVVIVFALASPTSNQPAPPQVTVNTAGPATPYTPRSIP